MLYQGALRFVTSAIGAIENRDLPLAHDRLVKAQAILTELTVSLDRERGGQVANNLASIYEYLNRLLIDANLRKDAAPAREVQRFLRELLPAWQEAVRQTAGAQRRVVAGVAQ